MTRWIALKDWVGGVAAELSAAAPTAHGWRQGKLSVQVRIFRVPGREGWFVPETEDPACPGGHWMTVELAWGETMATRDAVLSVHAPPALGSEGAPEKVSALLGSTEEGRRWLCDQLSAILGAPGFDSSSRATVFRESLEGLTREELVRVLERLKLDGVPIADERLRPAQHRLNGILRTGPLKSRSRGAEKLLEIMSAASLGEVERVLLEEWKTQDDWLD